MKNPAFDIDAFSDKTTTVLIYGYIAWSKKP